jgi:hypothetical protein
MARELGLSLCSFLESLLNFSSSKFRTPCKKVQQISCRDSLRCRRKEEEGEERRFLLCSSFPSSFTVSLFLRLNFFKLRGFHVSSISIHTHSLLKFTSLCHFFLPLSITSSSFVHVWRTLSLSTFSSFCCVCETRSCCCCVCDTHLSASTSLFEHRLSSLGRSAHRSL